MKAAVALAVLALGAQAALAAPKIDSLAVKPSPAKFEGGKAPEVEVVVAVSRGKFDTGGCDARVDFGDGQGRNIDFPTTGRKTLRHVYTKNGTFTVSVKGAGAAPCEGSHVAPLTVAGAPEPKKEPAKKAEEKKAEPAKKTEVKKTPAKKTEPKKKAPAKKPAPKKDEPK